MGTKGILGDMEEESAGTAVDVRFALTESRRLACRCHPVSVKGTLGEPSGEKSLQQGSEREGARKVAGEEF